MRRRAALVIGALLAALLPTIGLTPQPAGAAAITRSTSGSNPAAIQTVVDQFRTDVGGTNNGAVVGPIAGGRREINWDGVPDASASPANLPLDFFNSNSPRGVVFSTVGSAVQVSQDDDTGADPDPDKVRFSDINLEYATDFQTFSAQRLFTAIGSNVTTVNFFVPGSNTPATVSGFGAVFTDVDQAGTKIDYFDSNGTAIGSCTVPVATGNANLSFCGLSFNGGERIARVQITAGSGALAAAATGNDITAGGTRDVVAMDDFIYSEPQAAGSSSGSASSTILASTNANTLIRFNSASPQQIQSTVAVTGLAAGEDLVGIDLKVSNGVLYGVAENAGGSTFHLYRIDPTSGVATAIGSPFASPIQLGANVVGMDVDPVTGLIRVTSNATGVDNNFRIDPATGAPVDANGGVGGVQPDGAIPGSGPEGLAYNNNVVGAGSSTLYGLRGNGDELITFSNPNAGTISSNVAVTVNGAPFHFQGETGFDIRGDGTAFAALRSDVGFITSLYTINLATAAASLINTVGDGTPDLTGMTVINTGTIAFSASTYSVSEASGSATITVNRTGDTSGTVQVNFSTSDGTAVQPGDYTATSGTLTFGTGVTSQTFTVPVINDSANESDETVNLALSSPTNGASLGSPSTAVLTIVDDDSLPKISISDRSVVEGDVGTRDATFNLNLSFAVNRVVTLTASTAATGTATPGVDYQPITNTAVTFTANTTSTSVRVKVNGDTLDEANETFFVNLANATGAAINDGNAQGTIVDDDGGLDPVDRLAGPDTPTSDRIDTAIAVSQDGFPTAGTAGAVVLAKSTDFPDALAGTPLAVDKHAPLLLTPPQALDARTEAEIRRVLTPGSTVYVLGGDEAIDIGIDARLTQLGYAVVRLQGAPGSGRAGTAAAIADVGLGNPGTFLLVTGFDFADALAGGAAAAEIGGAILLTDGAVPNGVTNSYLQAHPGRPLYCLGGPACSAYPTIAAANQLVGGDRYRTSVAVAQKFFAAPAVVGLASGAAFPDGLAGGAHIGELGGPLLLTLPDTVPSGPGAETNVREYLLTNAASIQSGFVYGGRLAVQDGVLACTANLITGRSC